MLPKSPPDILHPDYFVEPFGQDSLNNFKSRLQNTKDGRLVRVPALTVAVQMYNTTTDELIRLMQDLDAQTYPGNVQRICLNAGEEVGLKEIAQEYGAEWISLDPASPSLRADFLNTAIEAASYDTVFTTVGHAALSNHRLLSCAAEYGNRQATAYGLVLPDANASACERRAAALFGIGRRLGRICYDSPVGPRGFTSACSVISASVIWKVGGYPKEYGGHGADRAMAIRIVTETSKPVPSNPLLSVHKSEGFGLLTYAREVLESRRSNPRSYDPEAFAWHPHGGL